MSIPVIPEHKVDEMTCEDCSDWDDDRGMCLTADEKGCPQKCLPGCPACAVEKNNKAWAKYLTEHSNGIPFNPKTLQELPYGSISIPASDWEQIKKLAEEKVDG